MSQKRSLPVVNPGPPTDLFESSLRADGSRATVYPADVRGRFASLRRVAFAALIALWIALPWIKVAGKPAIFLDVPARAFYFFGWSFNAQDLPLLFFLATGVAFALICVTAIAGRVWCGWACPQTVFLEGVFRPIERLIEGPREQRIRRNHGPWTAEKVARRVTTHAAYVVLSILIAHIVLSYFVSIPNAFAMVRQNPSAHPEAFAWTFGIATVLYINFGWFREQFCVVMCPYGRLQSVLLDDHSLVVGYDKKRGEPRGKASDKSAGACVDCRRCVVVCPTGIDIRNGLQLDCVACTACIDACDDVMDKLHRPRGLIRYDSLAGLNGEPHRFLRPRIWLYAGLGLLGIAASTFAFSNRQTFEATAIRPPGIPYSVQGDRIDNAFQIHVTNKEARDVSFTLTPEAAGATVDIGATTVELKAMASTRIPIVVHLPRANYRPGATATVKIVNGQGAVRTLKLQLAGPEP